MKKIILLIAAVALTLAGCSSDADKANSNLSKAAEQFEVQRRIVGINGITDKALFEVEGRCSLERADGQLDVICKVGPNDVRRTTIGLSDNVTYVSTQLEPVAVDFYRTRVILKPENIVPDFDLVTGESE